MGLDNRDYGRARRLNYDGGGSDPSTVIDAAYRQAVGREQKATRWFVLPLLFAVVLVAPLTFSQLAAGGFLQPAFLAQLEEHVFLPADSTEHFVLMGASAITFLLIACALFSYRLSTILVFTLATAIGTVASIWLLKLLWAAAATASPPVQGGALSLNGLLFAIRNGYQSLDQPGGAVRGYVFGVGVAEELAKVLPVFALGLFGFSSRVKLVAAFGLGVGFGLAEGVHYSETMYNGNAALPIYVVRFASLVALHGMWSVIAYGGLSMLRGLLSFTHHSAEPGQFLFLIAALAFAPAVLLHGFYDVYVGSPRHTLYTLSLVLLTCVAFSFVIYRRRASLAVGEWFRPR